MGPARSRLRSVAVSLCAALAVLATAPTADAVQTWRASPTASAREALRFWTPARMRAAEPLGAPKQGGGGLAGTSAATPEGADEEHVRRVEEALADFAQVPDPTAPGNRQNGAIFMVLPGGVPSSCSGTSVNAPNMSVVVTAAHCVNEGGPRRWFSRDWIFVPGYHDGTMPFGAFAAKWLGTTSLWFGGGRENGDVGAAVVSRNERGQRLGAAVGGYDIAWNLRPRQAFDVHGYPAEPPFDGSVQRVCADRPYLGHDFASFLWLGPLSLAVECAVTGGASGGGWTIHGTNVLNGVTSYGYGDDPFTDFGPYFGNAVRALYKRATRVR